MKFIVSILFLLNSFSFAGDSSRVGNGGGVLFCEKRGDVLLDVYESIFYEIHTFKNLQSLDLEARQKLLEKRIGSFSPMYKKMMNELRSFFEKNVNYLKVSSFKIPDDFNNLFYEDDCVLNVVAVQRKPILPFDNVFFINQSLWEKSSWMTQEGLIDHELLYLIALNQGAKSSKRVREFLAYLLSDEFLHSSSDDTEVLFYNNVLGIKWFSSGSWPSERRENVYRDLCEKLKRDYFFNCPVLRD